MPTTVPVPDVVPRRYVILHGWQNERPERHWQHWLAQKLARCGFDVRYPQLPDPHFPDLKQWLGVMTGQLTDPPAGGVVVICHSLACAAWMHLADRGSVYLPVDRLLFAAPPSPDFLRATPELAEFDVAGTTALATLASSRSVPRLAWARMDPYCPAGADAEYDPAFDFDCVPDGGHLDMDAGYHTWDRVYEWCLDERTRLGLNRPVTRR